MEDMVHHDPGLDNERIFSILERTSSAFSIIGSIVVIATFCLSKAFHKPINRLVFYATFGNLMTNVSTLIALSFIKDALSAGCQFQAFLIQMFMPADAFWTLAMALNVYLTFYFKFDAQQLRRMEIPYLIACYGVPFIVGLVCIFISTPEKGRMYGNATLWCWIAPKWDIFRICLFYGPIWVVIFITFFIYGRAGREIYKKHKQLKEFSTSHHDPDPLPPLEDLFSSVKTTEVFVTTEVIDKGATIDLAPLGEANERHPVASNLAPPQKPQKAAYSVVISAHRRAESQSGDIEQQLPIQTNISTGGPQSLDNNGPRSPSLARIASNTTHHTGAPNALTSISSSNGTTAAGSSTMGPTIKTTTTGATPGANRLRRRAAYEANNATWSYAKCAILFFTAMLVTWIPSSANRVYSVVRGGEASLALEFMSSFVLPLQGFWNAIIYCVTSWRACQILWEDIKGE
ncbi:hypothetical protein N0V88_002250 [Collariella sp. IMI 366227]|nr:hypothetical protein N0V88_002250 [Collariella sp. IMI 366227]